MFDDITSYLWKFSSGDGLDTIGALEMVLVDVEAGARRDASVLEVTGVDVAAYCDTRLPAHGVGSFVARWRAALNVDAARRIAD